MLKKLFNSFKKITQIEEKKEIEVENKVEEIDKELIEEEIKIVEEVKIEESKVEEVKNIELEKIELSEKEQEYIRDIKIKRQKSLSAINLYTEEVYTFQCYKECSKELNIPLDYITENLKYGYTDYFGEAIGYLSNKLNIKEYKRGYLDNKKSPLEIFNLLHDKIFNGKISDKKRDEILSSEKIDPIKMHYKFECIDEEYDEYFIKYKSIIQRGGKKKVELINTKGEVIEVFKSLDDCAKHIDKDKSEVTEMLKLYNTKVGRYEIRYSLRNI